MSLPPAARPPGRTLSLEARRDVGKVRRVQGSVSQRTLEKKRKEEERPTRPRSVQHIGPFRDGYNVLRKPNGRFEKETTLPHRRPQRKPPFSGPRK